MRPEKSEQRKRHALLPAFPIAREASARKPARRPPSLTFQFFSTTLSGGRARSEHDAEPAIWGRQAARRPKAEHGGLGQPSRPQPRVRIAELLATRGRDLNPPVRPRSLPLSRYTDLSLPGITARISRTSSPFCPAALAAELQHKYKLDRRLRMAREPAMTMQKNPRRQAAAYRKMVANQRVLIRMSWFFWAISLGFLVAGLVLHWHWFVVLVAGIATVSGLIQHRTAGWRLRDYRKRLAECETKVARGDNFE